MRRFSKRALAAFAFMIAGVGCSVIVGNDVPDFACSIDAPGVCPSGLHCDVTAKRCVAIDSTTPPDGPVTDDDAGDSTKPPTEGGPTADSPTGPYDLGGACRIDTDCKSGLCGSSTILTPTIVGTTGPICTMPCCSSADCPASLVCFNGGTGGAYCVPARLASRTPPTNGGSTAGSTCTDSSQCRSGLCGTPDGESGFMVCIDTCCADSECAGSSICRLGQVEAPAPVHTIWTCAPAKSSAVYGPGSPLCDLSSQCTTNACSSDGTCRPPCSNSASCTTIPSFPAQSVCIHGVLGSETQAFCLKNSGGGSDPVDTACADGSTCASHYCDQELRVCKNVCAKDSDCAGTEACRPSAAGTPYLRCVPKP